MKNVFLVLAMLLSFTVSAQVTNNIPEYIFNKRLSVGTKGVPGDTTAYLHVGPNGGAVKGLKLPMVTDTAAVAGLKKNGLTIFSVQLNQPVYWDSIYARWRSMGGSSSSIGDLDDAYVYNGLPGSVDTLGFWRNDSTLILRTHIPGYGLLTDATNRTDTTWGLKADTTSEGLSTKKYVLYVIDSAGLNDNFANADLTLTGDRTHNLNEHILTISSGNTGLYIAPVNSGDFPQAVIFAGGGTSHSNSAIVAAWAKPDSAFLARNVFWDYGQFDMTEKIDANGTEIVNKFVTGRVAGIRYLHSQGNDSTATIFPLSSNTNTGAFALAHDTTTGQIVRIPMTGGGGTDYNFAEDNLTLTGNRTHTFADYNMTLTHNGSTDYDESYMYFGPSLFESYKEYQTSGRWSNVVNAAGSSDAATYATIIAQGAAGVSTRSYFTANPTGRADIDGSLKLMDYGTGAKTGTATYNLAVDADGDVIEVAAGGGSGTVTSVADGWGISGGTITTTGTLIADSSEVASKLYVDQQIDLTEAFANAKVADAINNGTTTIAPSQNAVFDALALKTDITATKNYQRSNLHLINQALGSTILYESLGLSMTDVAGTENLIDARLELFAVYINEATTITGVKWFQTTQGNYTADNYNGVALYSYSGGTLTLVASSTNDGDIWKAASGAMSSKAFSSTYAASPGVYFIGFLYNNSAQTTAPAVGRYANTQGTGMPAMDYTNSARYTTRLTGQSSLPTPQAISGGTASSTQYYGALY